ncbi:MAG TPA: hypothetical protein VFE24_05255 [Pirellulales bacterium]|jgi:hypothetical protein|nr:hypothetical protein [Pirellulales bacterium]
MTADLVMPRQQHPWAHFAPGTSKKVSVLTQTLDAKGQVVGSSITETKTTLEKVDDDGVTLRVESTVEVGGKRFDSPVQVVHQGYPGQPQAQSVELKSLEPEPVTIEGKPIRCQVWQVKTESTDGKRLSKLYYSSAVAPYLLRKETKLSEASNPQQTHETTVEVLALDMPCRVLDEMHSVAYERTTTHNAKSTSTTVAVVSPDIPGGVVSSTSKEVDAAGKQVTRSTLELLEYNVAGDDTNPAQLRYRRLRRERVRARREQNG